MTIKGRSRSYETSIFLKRRYLDQLLYCYKEILFQLFDSVAATIYTTAAESRFNVIHLTSKRALLKNQLLRALVTTSEHQG